jgi:hypothetical protein
MHKYRMPDGKWTNDAVKMAKAWKKIYKPIENAFGITCRGFDPNISFADGNFTCNMSTNMAIKLSGILNAIKEL